MEFASGYAGREAEIVGFFADTFGAAEGAEEGRVIGGFVEALLGTTAAGDLRVVCARQDGALVGCICFSRMRYDGDARRVFILSPVAVATGRQKQGVGQRLLAQGLAELRAAGVDYVLTYGDPAYYSKVGFAPIGEDFARAPLPLSHPHGWLGQALSDDAGPLRGAAQCVPALNQPELW